MITEEYRTQRIEYLKQKIRNKKKQQEIDNIKFKERVEEPIRSLERAKTYLRSKNIDPATLSMIKSQISTALVDLKEEMKRW